MAKAVRANCVAATAPHGSTSSCLVSVAPLFGWAMCHPKLLLFSPLGEAMPVQLAQVLSVEFRAQPVIWQCGSPWHVPVVGPAGSSTLCSLSAVLLSSSCGSSALWIHLPWGCRTGLICSCCGIGEVVKEWTGEQEDDSFLPLLSPAENLIWNNIWILPRK